MKILAITEEIWKEGNMFTSYCPELDIATCGHTVDEAKKNLVEVIQIQIEETAKMGTLNELLEERLGANLDYGIRNILNCNYLVI